jgi:hypothetical protein
MAEETIAGTTAAGVAPDFTGAAMPGAVASVGAAELDGTAGMVVDHEGQAGRDTVVPEATVQLEGRVAVPVAAMDIQVGTVITEPITTSLNKSPPADRRARSDFPENHVPSKI